MLTHIFAENVRGMKEITLDVKVKIFSHDELPEEYHLLSEKSLFATKNAYAPYSGFHVGAAVLLQNGVVVTGSNQENAAYPSGLCAERVALFSANTQYPDVKVTAIAISAVTKGEQVEMVTPCGGCRQVMHEVETRFQHPINVLLCGKKKVYIIEKAVSLLPLSFELTAGVE